jgi:hypothetical protein
MTRLWMPVTAHRSGRAIARLWLIAWAAAALWHCTGDIGMAEVSLETEFRSAVQQSGDAYRETRKAILARGSGAEPFLQSQLLAGDWKISLTADILAGWLKTPALFDKCTDAVRGNIVDRIPITGSFSPKRRIAEINRLGRAVTPRLLEMVWKTGEYGGPQERESIFGGLAVLKDERSVVPLIDLMRTAPDEDIRGWAASTLGPLKDARAVSPLLDVVRSHTAPAELRASAAMSVGSLGAKEAVPELRTIALDEHLDLDLRKSAVRSLGDLGDSASAEPLLRVLSRGHDLAFELVILEAVGKIGSPSILPRLEDLEVNHHEAAVREGAKEAADEIKERSGAKRN